MPPQGKPHCPRDPTHHPLLFILQQHSQRVEGRQEEVDYEERDSNEPGPRKAPSRCSEAILSNMCEDGGEEEPFPFLVPGCKKVNGIKQHAKDAHRTQIRVRKHSDVLVVGVPRRRGACGPTRVNFHPHHTVSFHPLGTGCDYGEDLPINMLVASVPINPHQQLLISETVTLFSGNHSAAL
ncbi:juxtaposed with another zinc finger protein 1 [Lynx pardinus]|uniref:Juxtaposed with another zinc finger protein 1 n=1 Tax=Lynx pardinus TaxID=191816 RepID=A0A485MHX4_LYNPA|nr:juxtaposed with another zinc finger protein 1 [Lynx pardinus]